ncbi:protein OS-9 homolog [Arachis duranensis]|uniref:Protein OS-9 homolog n=1 Tax=Arachis duranensis TaxID=130453 RepID=A0A9C6TCZ8_ARADU|nr:protein OS-9 homolog [Arachis duranensis]
MKALFLLLISHIILSHVFGEHIFPANIGSTFGGGSSREPKYKIEFHSEESPYHPDDDQESIVMPGKNGQKFICYLPRVEKEKSGKPVIQQNVSSMIVETEKRAKQKTPDELLEVLNGPCFVRQEGWWSYEFCYKKKLRQLHLEDDKVVQEFVLGVYDPEATAAYNQNLSDISTLKDPRSKDASQRYHAHQYTNGTTCDLTSKPRETEVRFVCSEPRAMISWPHTRHNMCKMGWRWHDLYRCRLFQEERPVWHTIDCNALAKDYKDDDKVRVENRDMEIVMVTDSETNYSE